MLATGVCVTTTIFLLLAVATTPTFCHQELETLRSIQTQIDQNTETLTLNRKVHDRKKKGKYDGDNLKSWNPATSEANFTVAKDGSGTHKTIKDALAAVDKMDNRKNQRVIIYVKRGVYKETVEIKKHLKNLMFVGDGIDKTIVTSSRRFKDDDDDDDDDDDLDSLKTAYTFGVSADGFWARDMTFEKTGNAAKGQAGAAVRVSSDESVFYRCSFKGYRNTLSVVSHKQFYRDCKIYGSVDTIIGNAAVVFQNCDIFVRKPLKNQNSTITAHGGDESNKKTGISIQGSRVRPAPDFVTKSSSSARTFLGRPWKKYSKTVIFKTDIDDIIDPKGWTERADHDSTTTHSTKLFYAEYKNTGGGASTKRRVDWPGFHVLKSSKEVSPYTVSELIQGDSWIPATGVPCQFGV